MSTPPPVINDRYEVIRRIGRGGMADVFVGRDRLLDRQIALKVLFPEFAVDPNFVERFRREAQAAANLNHPNIVNVFDWGKSGSTYYIAMEYVEGRTLADILRANKQLTSKQAAEIAGEVAAALGFAHSAGLVHRDIKPANILIGTAGSVKVADFGIARALNSPTESNLTQAGAVMGTATYFSPEQAQGAQPDPRSDLYSLGVVMYEMIAGRPPFTGENPVAIAYKQVHDYPTPLNKLVVDVPRAFEAIVAKLLTKDPNVRYSTADAVREDLRRFRAGEVPVALQAAGAARNTAQTPTVVGPVTPGTGPGNGHNRPSQQLTAVQRTQAGGPRTAQRPPTGSLPQVGYDEPPKRTGWYALAAFFAIIALGLGGFLLFRTLTGDAGQPDSRALPDYIGWELQLVKDDLDERGLVAVPIPEESDAVEPGQVHRTDPSKGVVVARGSTVRVYFREIETTATIPDVRGRTEADARAALEQLGFVNVTVQYEVNDDEDDGTVLAIDPAAGETVRVTDEITLTVARASGDAVPPTDAPTSTAADLVTVPFVIGQSEANARRAITDAGLEVEVRYFDNFPVEVLDQSPSAGRSLPRGDTVTINVGNGVTPTPTRPPQTNPQPTQPQPTQPQPTQAATTTTQAATTTTQAATTTTSVPSGG